MEISKATMKKLVLLIAFAALAFTAFQWFDGVAAAVHFLNSLLSPFIAGAILAFIINVPMRFFENKLVGPLTGQNRPEGKKRLPKGLCRVISLILTIASVVAVLVVLIFFIVPQLASTVSGLGETIQNAFYRFISWAELQFSNNPQLIQWIETATIDWETIDWEALVATVIDFLKNGAGSVLDTTITAAKSVVSIVTNLVIAFVFSFYILLQKEKLGRQCKKAIFAILPKKGADYLMKVCTLSQRIFSSFITGQCTEAVILGFMFFVTMSIMRMEYALLVSCVIALTALIPIVGAFIGCIFGAFLLLMISPAKALVFVVTFLILQQIEGNLIYPHVVGSSVGLPSIWVLMAVTLGGSLMGIAGMLVFIPLMSVLYSLFRDFVNVRLQNKNITL